MNPRSGGIVMVLPASESFDPDRAGAIALVVHRLAGAADATVIGRPLATPFPGIEYRAASDRSPLHYNLAVLRHLVAIRPASIEIHQQPRLASLAARALPRSRVMLFLHNDPLSMRGLRRPGQRPRMVRRLHRVVCVSGYLAERFATSAGERDNEQARKSFFFKKKKQKTFFSSGRRWFNRYQPDVKKFFCFFFFKKRSASLPFPAILPNPLTLADLPARAPSRTILFAGRIVENKGIADFIAACATALPQLPGWSAIVIGGDRFGAAVRETGYVAAMREQARAASIQWLGYRPHRAVLEAMAAAAIVVVPSRWPEPFGLTALEAMASGAALIASDTGGLPEVAGDSAILVPPGDVAALAGAILRLANDAAGREALVEAGLARAALFDTPVIAARLQALRDGGSPV